MLAGGQEALGHDDAVVAAVGVGVDLGAVLAAVQVDRLGLAREDHGHVAKLLGGDAGEADAGGLDGQDLVDGLAVEQSAPLLGHVRVQLDVAAVVEEAVDLEHIALTDDSLTRDALLEFLHAVAFPVRAPNAGGHLRISQHYSSVSWPLRKSGRAVPSTLPRTSRQKEGRPRVCAHDLPKGVAKVSLGNACEATW